MIATVILVITSIFVLLEFIFQDKGEQKISVKQILLPSLMATGLLSCYYFWFLVNNSNENIYVFSKRCYHIFPILKSNTCTCILKSIFSKRYIVTLCHFSNFEIFFRGEAHFANFIKQPWVNFIFKTVKK